MKGNNLTTTRGQTPTYPYINICNHENFSNISAATTFDPDEATPLTLEDFREAWYGGVGDDLPHHYPSKEST